MQKTAEIIAVLLVLAFFFVTAKFPETSRSGEPAAFTVAIANQDMPSGIYYDRDFDWPTGEAIWLGIPVFMVDGCLLFGAVLFGVFAFKYHRVKTKPICRDMRS